MPQVYDLHPEPQRGRSSSSASSSSMSSVSPGSMRPTDADESIVLSDLVRTGEASRLRRRGAMRIDHGAPFTVAASPATITDRPNWDSYFNPDSQTAPDGHWNRTPLSRFSRIRPHSSRRYGPHDTTSYIHLRDQPNEFVYTLVCGAKFTNFDMDDKIEPFKPSILPLYPPLPFSSNKKSTDRNTGCGTVVHMHAAPRVRVGMWTAHSTAPSSVVSLEGSYFDAREAAEFTQSDCGCVKEGVGCAVCGNPLGIRYTPCKAASDSFLQCNNRKIHSADTLTRLRGPEGPQYWQASSSQSPDHAIYTFFSRAVTSTPQYDFPPTKSVRRQRAYSDVSIELVSSPTAVTPIFPSGNESDFYRDTEDSNVAPEWDRLGEGYNRDDEEIGEHADVPRPEMILDRFSASSPVPVSEPVDENAPVTNASVSRGSWGFSPGYLRHHNRSTINPTSALNFRSFNDNQPLLQYAHESFYQQQVLGAWERERGLEEMDRARHVDNDGWGVSVNGWGLNLDGESENVWGVVDAWPADPYDSESADKSTEGPLFPGR